MKPGDWGGRRAQQARHLIEATLPAPCIKCGHTVWPWQPWDLGHHKDRDTHPHLTWEPANWGPQHRGENRADGARAATAKRSRATTRTPTTPDWTAPGW